MWKILFLCQEKSLYVNKEMEIKNKGILTKHYISFKTFFF